MNTETPLSKANTCFALNLLKDLCDVNRTSNVFFSPLSISSALAMVLLGARGKTAQQITECLKFTDFSDDVHSSFGSLLQDLQKPGVPYVISVANRLYGEKTHQFYEDFLRDTKQYYHSELETVDFLTKCEEARVTINNWVEKQTKDKIKNPLLNGAVDNSTKLVLVDAIYFKGNWSYPFDMRATHESSFRINTKDTKPVMMMHTIKSFPYAHIDEAKCQVISLPYEGQDLSMVIFLPNDIEDSTTGLEKLEQLWNYENFLKWTQKMYWERVDVSLPRFIMEETYDLKGITILKDIFVTNDFSGMSPSNDLELSVGVHKAFVEVNEERTEAAAATISRLVVGSRKYVKPSPKFIADHPFIFFIRHTKTNSVLFAGRFCSPK